MDVQRIVPADLPWAQRDLVAESAEAEANADRQEVANDAEVDAIYVATSEASKHDFGVDEGVMAVLAAVGVGGLGAVSVLALRSKLPSLPLGAAIGGVAALALAAGAGNLLMSIPRMPVDPAFRDPFDEMTKENQQRVKTLWADNDRIREDAHEQVMSLHRMERLTDASYLDDVTSSASRITAHFDHDGDGSISLSTRQSRASSEIVAASGGGPVGDGLIGSKLPEAVWDADSNGDGSASLREMELYRIDGLVNGGTNSGFWEPFTIEEEFSRD